MTKIRSLTKVANCLGITEQQARYFCQQVQKCFKGYVPPFSLIAEYLEQSQEKLSNPETFARQLAESDMFNGHTFTFEVRSARTIQEMVREKNRGRVVHREPRVEQDRIAKCPHGVPGIQLCALCNPKAFREMTGID